MSEELITRIRQRAVEEAHSSAGIQTPLDESSILRAEVMLECKLPPVLRDVYRVVGNGGFGPGYGLLPLVIHSGAIDVESVVDLFAAFCTTDPEDPAWVWPRQLLPFCDWGCAIRSCVDCSTRDGAVVTFDPNVHAIGEPLLNSLAQTHASVDAWFRDWLDGVKIWDLMFELETDRATTGINPFTKEPISIVPTKLRRC